MKKIILFSIFLLIGLAGSQIIPSTLNPEAFGKLKSFFDAMLYICLAFIMINVGREFGATAGIVFIALGYGLGGPLLAISLLTILTNLILTGFFVVLVKHLALKAETTATTR